MDLRARARRAAPDTHMEVNDLVSLDESPATCGSVNGPAYLTVLILVLYRHILSFVPLFLPLTPHSRAGVRQHTLSHQDPILLTLAFPPTPTPNLWFLPLLSHTHPRAVTSTCDLCRPAKDIRIHQPFYHQPTLPDTACICPFRTQHLFQPTATLIRGERPNATP